jgi:hypothetical protein
MPPLTAAERQARTRAGVATSLKEIKRAVVNQQGGMAVRRRRADLRQRGRERDRRLVEAAIRDELTDLALRHKQRNA